MANRMAAINVEQKSCLTTNDEINKKEDVNEWSDLWNLREEVDPAGDDTIINREVDSDSDNEDDVMFSDMQIFFHSINEPHLIDRFTKHKVTLGQLLDFDEQDLINCGIDLVGERKKILENTAKMHCEKWQPTSLNDLTSRSMLSSPGIYVALNDINKHFEYIGITFKYIRRRIKMSPDILELGKDFVGLPKVKSELEDLQKTVRTTCSELKALNNQIFKLSKNPFLMPANHIDEQYLRRARFRRKVLPIILATVLAGIAFKVVRHLLHK